MCHRVAGAALRWIWLAMELEVSDHFPMKIILAGRWLPLLLASSCGNSHPGSVDFDGSQKFSRAESDVLSVDWASSLLEETLQIYPGTWRWEVKYHGIATTCTVSCIDNETGAVIGEVFLDRTLDKTVRKHLP